jgi:hypothetical protein
MGNKQPGFKAAGHKLGSTQNNSEAVKTKAVKAARARQQASSSNKHKKRTTKSTSSSSSSTTSTTSTNGRPKKKRNTPPKIKSLQETEQGRSLAAEAAAKRAGAWDNKIKKGKQKATKARRVRDAELNQQLGTAKASREESLQRLPKAKPLPKVDLTGFDPTQAVFRSSAQAAGAMQAAQSQSQSAQSHITTGTTSAPSSSSSSGSSQFSSSILNHHSENVDQKALTKMNALIFKSSIQQRKEGVIILPKEIQNQLISIFNDQNESPDLDFAIARLTSNVDTAATFKAVSLVMKIVGNILQHPGEEKYQSLRLTTSAAQKKLLPVTGAMDVLAAAGFELVDVGGDSCAVRFSSGKEGSGVKLAAAAERIAMVGSRLKK